MSNLKPVNMICGFILNYLVLSIISKGTVCNWWGWGSGVDHFYSVMGLSVTWWPEASIFPSKLLRYVSCEKDHLYIRRQMPYVWGCSWLNFTCCDFLYYLYHHPANTSFGFWLFVLLDHHEGHHHHHVHDSAVTSVSIVSEGTLDLDEVTRKLICTWVWGTCMHMR